MTRWFLRERRFPEYFTFSFFLPQLSSAADRGSTSLRRGLLMLYYTVGVLQGCFSPRLLWCWFLGGPSNVLYTLILLYTAFRIHPRFVIQSTMSQLLNVCTVDSSRFYCGQMPCIICNRCDSTISGRFHRSVLALCDDETVRLKDKSRVTVTTG